jgi:hypothetical protein
LQGYPRFLQLAVIRSALTRAAKRMATETSGAQGRAMEGNGVAQKRRKLHGRAFYESIGSPKLVLAPMVEQSEFVRLIFSSLPRATHHLIFTSSPRIIS